MLRTGTSGKTAGRIQRALRSGKRAKASSEHRPMRTKPQPTPTGWTTPKSKRRFPHGKYHTPE